MNFEIHDKNSAPEDATALLEKMQEGAGFIPNLAGAMAEAPALLEAYMAMSGIFDKTSFSATERQVILLAISFENGCSYCMAAHSALAKKQGTPDEVINALRAGKPVDNDKLESLRRISAEIVKTRGRPSDELVKRFLNAGYTKAQLLEVVLGVGLKTLSNYTNHIVKTPLDEAFEDTAWKKDKAA